MTTVHLVVGSAVVLLFAVAGAWGAWCWRRARPSPAFWRLLRAAQLVLGIQVVLGGILLALGHRAHSQLHYLYGLLPLVISLIAEQLRISAAEAVLIDRGHASAQEVGELPIEQQQAIVRAIVRREIGVMALAALAIVVLALRAASTSGGL